jgi:hypothetical protein
VQDAEEAHKAEIIKLKVRFESFLRLETWGRGEEFIEKVPKMWRD